MRTDFTLGGFVGPALSGHPVISWTPWGAPPFAPRAEFVQPPGRAFVPPA